MIELEFVEKKIKKFMPEELAECDSRQYREMSRLIFLYQSGSISFDQFQALGVFVLLDIKRSTKSENPEDEFRKFQNLALLSEYVANFFEINQVNEVMEIAIKQYYIHNPMPSFKYMGIPMYGPTDNFDSVTFGQYVDGLGLFLDYAKNGEFSTLVKLLNIFYSPKWKFLKRVFAFQEKKLDIGAVYGFYLYFASFQKFLTSAKIEVDGVEIDLSIIFEADASEKNYGSDVPGLGFRSIIYSISESGVFGSIDQVRSYKFWDVILRLYDVRKRGLDEKAEHEKLKSKSK